MVDFYVKKILDGNIKVTDVPKLWRSKVEKRMNEIQAAEDKITIEMEESVE